MTIVAGLDPNWTVGVDEIRSHFPALERTHAGYPVAYFDGPGGTQVPRSVVAAMDDYLFHHNANTHWLYPSSQETDDLIARARAALADFVFGRPDEIVFGQNMTTLTFHLARAIGRELGKGDEIVLTELDHHGNVAPWRALEKERGVTVRMAQMRLEDGTLDWNHYQSLLNPRTKVVAIFAASNALGTLNGLNQASKMARAAAPNVRIFVDAVHYAPHKAVDVKLFDCDFVGMSAYKFYGPHIGVLWGKRAAIEALDAPRLDPAPQESPERLETGTQNHEAIVGAGAAVDFIASLAVRSASRRDGVVQALRGLEARNSVLFEKLWYSLTDIDGVRLYGPEPGRGRTPTLSFTLRGRSTDHVATKLAQRGVFVSNGDFYAATIADRYGVGGNGGGFVRAGCSCYTTEEEIDRLIEGVHQIAAGRA
ncbi:MAG TPA: cysteine desulfurase-like protein [Gemmatimonadaceae bacterium]|jgi:cysteine desulfurase family protein (TIGR01976 family)|nr:cysteine desulfurase-like protein [Gemmatimonadaceae bacterium]